MPRKRALNHATDLAEQVQPTGDELSAAAATDADREHLHEPPHECRHPLDVPVCLERLEQEVEVHRLLVGLGEPRVGERGVERAVEAVCERRRKGGRGRSGRGRVRGVVRGERGGDLEDEEQRLERDVERRGVCDEEQRVDVRLEAAGNQHHGQNRMP